MPGVVLLTRGIFADWQSGELERAVAVVQASGRYSPVVGAYVDHGTPDLAAALDTCAEAGATRILVAPIYAPMDRFLNTWLPQILRRWLRRRPHFRGVEVILASNIGNSDVLGHAALENLASAERDGASDEIDEQLGVEYGNPGFWVIPRYRYQALVCTGPRCATRGSAEIYERVRDGVARYHMARTKDEPAPQNRVSVIRTGCLFPCNLGPVMVVHPGDTWYCALTPSMVDHIVDQHFVSGQVVPQYTRSPGAARHARPTPAQPGDIVEDFDPLEVLTRTEPPPARKGAAAP